MKIAFIEETAFTSRHGGAAAWTLTIARYLSQRGIQTKVFSFAKDMRFFLPRRIALFPFFREVFVYPFVGQQMVKKIQNDYDIIYFASSTTNALNHVKTPTLTGTNCLFSRQLQDFSPFLPIQHKAIFNPFFFQLLKNVEKKHYQNTRSIISTRKDITKFLQKTLSIPKAKIYDIPHAVFSVPFLPSPPKKENRVVLFVGRATFGKGFDVLLDAADEIHGKVVCIVSRISEAYLSKAAKKKNVQIITGVTPNDLRRYYQNATVFVMPSLSETGPIVTLEAMSFALPIVGTPQGCGEFVDDGFHGFVVPPYSPQLLAQKVNSLIEHPKVAREMGINAQQKVKQHYTMDIVGEKILAVCHALVT